MVRKLFTIKGKEWLLFGILVLIGFAIGICAQYAEGIGKSYYQFSTVGLMGLPILLNYFIGTASINNDFSLAMGMGRTRKSFFVAEVLIELFKNSAIIVLGFLSYVIQKNIYSDIKEKTGIDHFFKWDVVIMVIFATTMITILFSMLLIKFEKKVFWVMWVIYMLMCFLPGRINDAMKNNSNSILAKFGRLIMKAIENVDKTKCMMMGGVIIVFFTIISFYIAINEDIKS